VQAWVQKRDASEVQREYPIADRLPGWFFRMQEVSNGCWIVEGTDLWGRQVSDSGTDEQVLLESCIAAAERVNARIADGGNHPA
jgi:hypothetical protein